MRDEHCLATALRASSLLLHPDDVAHIAEPGLADAAFELEQGPRGAFRAALWGVLVAISVAFFARRFRAFSERRWPGVVAIVTATSVGAFALTESDRPEVARVQMLFLALGAFAAVWIGTCRGESLRRVAMPLGALSSLSLVATALFGEEADGAARWLALGPLVVHVAVLVWPWALAGIAEALAQGHTRIALGIGITAQLGLLLQRDPSTLAVFTLAFLAAAYAVSARVSWALLASGALAFIAAWRTRVALEPIGAVDGAWQLAQTLGPIALVIGIVASLLVALAPLRALHATKEVHAHAFGVGAATALAGFCMRPLLNQHDAVFFLGQGGSPIVGALVACAIVSAWMPERGERVASA